MRACTQCSRELADDFRFCPHCGAAQRSKVVEYFRGDTEIDDGWLRISAYLTQPRHVRMSIWREDEAKAALSLDPGEAHRLGRFLLAVTPRREGIAGSLRRGAAAVREAVRH
jgi:zinc-ribbon domain